MMTVCAQPEQHPQNKSFAICKGEAIHYKLRYYNYVYSTDIIRFILVLSLAVLQVVGNRGVIA